MLFSRRDIILILACFFVAISYVYAYAVQVATPLQYLICIGAIYLAAPPKYLLHPKNFLFGFHFIWYTFPLMYASRYEDNQWTTYEEVLAFCMLICTFIVGYLTFHFTCKEKEEDIVLNVFTPARKLPILWTHLFATGLTVATCLLLLSKHGLSVEAISRLHFNREGTGVLNILLIFSSGLSLSTAGYLSGKKKSVFLYFIYFVYISFILVFLQHRSRLLLFLMLLFLPQVYYLKANLKTIGIAGMMGGASFLLGTFLRSSSALTTAKDSLKYVLNYFDTYDMLLYSVRDFPPAVTFKTTFMAFNKFLTPFGFDPNNYYHMSLWLTDHFFNTGKRGVSYRTTMQFPVETDMYLSLSYVYGIPLLVLYFYSIGVIYRLGFRSKSLGATYVSVILMMRIVGHLRGALISWSDLYTFPILIVSYYLLNYYTFSDTKEEEVRS